MTIHDKRMTPVAARVRLDQLPRMVLAERTRRGLSQRAMAAELRLTASTIHRVEKGQWPDVAGLLAICAWLNLPPGWLIGNDGQPHMDAYRRGWDDHSAITQAGSAIDSGAAS